jgi:hypothetical protein
MSTGQQASITSGLTRRAAVTQVAAGGIAAIGLGVRGVAAQDATKVATEEGGSPLDKVRLATKLLTALVPVLTDINSQSDAELDQSAKTYIEQLQKQRNVTQDEASALQQIVDAANTEPDAPTTIEKIQGIADKLSQEGEGVSPAALAIAVIAVAVARRDERSTSAETATPATGEQGTEFRNRLKRGLIGTLAGAAVGGSVGGDDGAVIGAIAGGLIGAM